MYLNKILLTTDFSEASLSAFNLAVGLAKQTNSELTLINIVERAIMPVGFDGYVPPAYFMERIDSEQLESASHKLKELVTANLKNFPVNTVALQSYENPAATICRYANEGNYGLIVIANQGRSMASRLLYGSTTELMTRLSKKPVMIAHASKDSAESGIRTSENFKNILVTTDFSTDSELAFKYAAYEAKLSRAKVTLVHVIQSLLAPELLNIRISNNDFDAVKIQDEYKASLSEKLKRYAKEHFPISEVEIKLIEKQHSTSASIVEFADKGGFDLIVISTHGANRTLQLIGGVAERVVRGADSTVLLIPKSF